MKWAVVVRKGNEEIVWSLHRTERAAFEGQQKCVRDLLRQGQRGHWYNGKIYVEQYLAPR